MASALGFCLSSKLGSVWYSVHSFFILFPSVRLSLPLANAIDVTHKIPRSNTASPVPGIRHHNESESDSESDSESSALGDKFITRLVILYTPLPNMVDTRGLLHVFAIGNRSMV